MHRWYFFIKLYIKLYVIYIYIFFLYIEYIKYMFMIINNKYKST